MADIVVLGAGVVGLTTALELARKGHKITVVAAHFPGDYVAEYASPWAGANWCSATFGGSKSEQYERDSFVELYRLAKECAPEVGIYAIPLKEYHTVSLEESGLVQPGQSNVWYRDLVPNFRIFDHNELIGEAKSGVTFTSVCINSPIYLSWLQAQLTSWGAKYVKIRVSNICEASRLSRFTANADLIVNCCGLGARNLGGVCDGNVFPVRGQTVLVKNRVPSMILYSSKRTDADPVYIFPRPQGGTILGGCREENNWNANVDYDLAKKIMERCCTIYPELAEGQGPQGLEVIGHNVGFRPYRKGGPRVESEEIDGIPIVHNYGAAGGGYQMSYGLAYAAVALVEESLEKKKKLSNEIPKASL